MELIYALENHVFVAIGMVVLKSGLPFWMAKSDGLQVLFLVIMILHFWLYDNVRDALFYALLPTVVAFSRVSFMLIWHETSW